MSDPAVGGSDPPAVHQFVPALIPRDATGSHTLLLRQALRAAGWRSEIFAEAVHDELKDEGHPVDRYADVARPGDVLVYQFSTSSMVAEYLLGRPERLVLDYHNVTRPELCEPWDPAGARRSAEAFEQLEQLAPRAALGMADSAFNEEDLRRAGCQNTAVVPVLVDLERLGPAPDERVLGHLAEAGEGADWLFVGRVVPSKAQHQLVEALWAYRRLYDPRARLHLVGPAPIPGYLAALRAFVDDLGLDEAVRLAGEVSDAALAAYFATADVYVSLSVHEGFGVPLLEAMAAGVPVVARRAGAVPATVADAGLVLERAEPGCVAAAVHRVLADPVLRDRMVAAGRRRVDRHRLDATAGRAVAAIATVAGDPPARPQEATATRQRVERAGAEAGR